MQTFCNADRDQTNVRQPPQNTVQTHADFFLD